MSVAVEAGDRKRLRSPALLGLAVAAASGVGIGAAVHLALGGGQASPARQLEGQATWPAGKVAAPNFALRDQNGRLVALRSMRGRTVLLAFMDSRCHQVCPLEGRVLAHALARLPREARPALLVVSVDPWADTRRSARTAASHWGFAGDWHWLLGGRAELAKVWSSYRIYVKRAKGDIVHSDAVYIIDGRGFERVGLLFPFLPGPVQRDLTALARGA
jgi:cytochrome oxidase Cu insertion factor (SCO1/SenC/PrrC family)